MSTQTTNLGLIKDDPSEFYDIGRVNQNLDKIDAAVGDTAEMKTAGGTGTAITLSIPSVAAYKANQKFSFIASANNAGNATTIKVNALAAKPLYKPNTTTAPNIVAGKAYEVWYNQAGDCFFLKASAEGNAIAANVLAGKTFSNDDDSGIAGTMVNNGSVGTINLASEGSEYLIPQGYHNGLGKIKAVITNLIASVIKAGTTVGGILGTFTSDATAVAGEILSGKTAYVNGNKITGTIPSKGAATITPGTANQTIAAGQYLSGIQTIAGDVDLVAANIKKDVNLFGVVGEFTGGTIASIQTGILALAGYNAGLNRNVELTISPVDLSKSVCFAFPYLTGVSGQDARRLTFTANNKIAITCGPYAIAVNLRWYVITFNDRVKAIHTIVRPSLTAPTNITIPAVVLANSIIIESSEFETTGGTINRYSRFVNSTTVEVGISRSGYIGGHTVFVVEFFELANGGRSAEGVVYSSPYRNDYTNHLNS